MLKNQKDQIQFEQLKTLEDKFEYAKSMHLVAKFEEGLSYFRILKSEYEALKRYDKVLDCLGWICQNLANLGRVEELYKYLPEYKSICNDYGTELNNLKLYSYLAFTSASIGDEDSAIEYYLEVINLAKKLKDKKRYIFGLINLQTVYILTKDFPHAYDISLEVQATFEKDPDLKTTMSEAAYYLNLVTIKLEWNELDCIEHLLQSFEDIPKINHHQRELMYYHCLKGQYYNKLSRYYDAINELEKAYSFIKKTKEEPFLTIILENLIKAYENIGNYKEALHYSKKFNDKLMNQQKKRIKKETIKVIKEIDLESMKQLVYVDTLTSIPNRRSLDKFGGNLVDDASRMGLDIHCAIIDIDHFKFINDRFGHIIGDLAIQQLATIIKNTLPENTVFARFAGDEFVILFEQLTEAENYFQQLFSKITNFEFQTDEVCVKLTISMGVASLSDCNVKELKILLDLADQALYQSKQNGRNYLSFYSNNRSLMKV